ncbi:MAG: hypothetical protein CMH52_07540 [Myxococcales bacterium]|nr:hypothetical protein [Myxococcales bacterium]
MKPCARHLQFAFLWCLLHPGPGYAETPAAGDDRWQASDTASDTPSGPQKNPKSSSTQTEGKKQNTESEAAKTVSLSTETGLTTVGKKASKKSTKAPAWSASSMSIGQSVSTLTFDPAAELDYNPYYAVTLGLAPSWAWSPLVYTSAQLAFSREITQANTRNRADEIWLSDASFTLGYTGYTVPKVGIRIAADLTATAPTSPLSKAQTLQLGLQPAIALSKRVAVLSGLTLGYRGSFRLNIHDYTTAELSSPRIGDCRGETCAQFLNTGVRNTQYQQGHSFSLGLGLLDWLSVSTNIGVYLSHLYAAVEADQDEFLALEPMDTRYAISYGLGASLTLPLGMTMAMGVSTFNPQRAPNNTYYRPFFNRFSQVYLDLRFRPSMWFQN